MSDPIYPVNADSVLLSHAQLTQDTTAVKFVDELIELIERARAEGLHIVCPGGELRFVRTAHIVKEPT